MTTEEQTSLIMQDPVETRREDRVMSCILGIPYDSSQAVIDSLQKDETTLSSKSVYVPNFRAYWRKIRRLASRHKDNPDGASDARELLAELADGAKTGTWVLRLTHVMSGRGRVQNDGAWYPAISDEAIWLRTLLGEARVQYGLEIRHPRDFHRDMVASDDYPGINAESVGPEELRWSRIVKALRKACPDVPLIVWRAEDAPFIWHQILRATTGLEEASEVTFAGAFDPLDGVMAPTGIERAKSYIAENAAHLDPKAVSTVLTTFHSYFPKPAEDGAANPDADSALDAQYAADVDEIAKIDGVRLLRR